MTRKKLKLTYIANESMRKATFNKRKNGFFKKIHELSVLCGIEACAVIYSPFSSNPEVWPSNSDVKNVVEKFEMLPEMEQEKKMLNHESFLRQSITKTMENNNKKMKDNTERTMKEAMFMFLAGKGDKLKLSCKNREDLCMYIDQYLKELYHHRNETLNQPRLEYGESSSASNVMAPEAIAHDGFNSPQVANELWGLRQEQVTTTFENNFISADQQGYYQMVNQVGVYGHHSNLNVNHNQYQQQFEYPVVSEDGDYNPN